MFLLCDYDAWRLIFLFCLKTLSFQPYQWQINEQYQRIFVDFRCALSWIFNADMKKKHSIFNADAKNTTEFHWKDQIRKTNTKSPFIDRFKSVKQHQINKRWIANNNLSKPFCQNVRKQRWKIAMQFTSISKTVRIKLLWIFVEKFIVVYAIDFTVFCIIVDKSLLRLDASGWKERFVRTMGP